MCILIHGPLQARSHNKFMENQTMASNQKRVLGTAPANYSNGLVVPEGQWVLISGQVAVNEAGEIVGEGDCLAQCRQAFANMRALLEEAGGTMADVVKITTFIKDMADFQAFNTARNEAFSAPYPASTIVEVSDFFRPGLLVEIEAMAVL